MWKKPGEFNVGIVVHAGLSSEVGELGDAERAHEPCAVASDWTVPSRAQMLALDRDKLASLEVLQSRSFAVSKFCCLEVLLLKLNDNVPLQTY